MFALANTIVDDLEMLAARASVLIHILRCWLLNSGIMTDTSWSATHPWMGTGLITHPVTSNCLKALPRPSLLLAMDVALATALTPQSLHPQPRSFTIHILLDTVPIMASDYRSCSAIAINRSLVQHGRLHGFK